MPIIDPMWFYWIQVVDAIKSLLMAISIIGVGIMTGIVIMCIIEEEKEGLIKYICVTIFFFILLTVALLIPERQTLIQMKAAEYATHENIESIITEIEKTAEKIIGD